MIRFKRKDRTGIELTSYQSCDKAKGMKSRGDMAGLIREAFHVSGMSMKQLADRSNSHYASIYGFLVSGRDIKLSTVERVCDVLGLELRQSRNLKPGKQRRK